MHWSGNLDEFATWVRSPDVLAGPEFDRALESVPDDQVTTVETTLCAILKADRDAFRPKPHARDIGDSIPSSAGTSQTRSCRQCAAGKGAG